MFLRLAILFLALPLAAQTVRPNLNGLELRKGHMIQQAQVDARAQLAAATKAQVAAQKAFATAKPAGILKATQNLTAANSKLKNVTTRVGQLQNQMTDWESKTLAVHGAGDGKHKVDWTKGTITAK